MLSKSHNLVVVSFREENLQKIHDSGVYPKIRETLAGGIRIMGRQFHFLCASASQIRDHKAFFVEVSCPSEVYSLRKLIIEDPNKFTVAAQYLSRIGLFCTADRPTIEISRSDMGMINDVKADDSSLVTDGSGLIKRSKAEEVFRALGEATIPSAFQFRLGGLKGVLTVVDDNLVEQLNAGKSLHYRPSQKKFESDHSMLGVVKRAEAHPLKLNREAITLLESWYLTAQEKDTWHLPSAIISLQESFLETQADMFENGNEAQKTLMQYLPSKEVEANSEVFELQTEPFWFRLLRHCHVFAVQGLCKKTNIPVKDGCLIMGVPDCTDCLLEDEVFLQVAMEDEEPHVIEGLVLMYRNPCLHPGDIRLVTAVNKPQLQGHANVLVLPGKGRTSLSGMCSGGDLDGDQFSVIWDKSLVPTNKRLQHKALDYQQLPGNCPEERRGEAWTQENLAAFYVNCMENDSLGRVAHMHLAFSDIAETGAADPAAMKLAESQAVAVDYPKTGISPRVPKEAMEKVKDTGYPDFMEKTRGESYTSTKLLGKLYQSSRSCLFEYEISEEDYRKIPLDQALVAVEGTEKYMAEAESIYNEYVTDMKLLMHQFSLRSEEEVVLGRAVRLHSLLDNDREKVYSSLKENFRALKEKYKNQILQGLKPGEYEPMVSACYRVAYDQNREDNKRKRRDKMITSRPFLSFPWTVGEILRQIKKKSSFLPPKTSESTINKEIGWTVKLLMDKDLAGLKSSIKEKEEIFASIKSVVESEAKNRGLEVFPYGSSSVFLSEDFSDIDICVKINDLAYGGLGNGEEVRQLPETKRQAHFLVNNISAAVDQVLDKKVDLSTNDVPVIKGEINATNVDISCNEEGSRKTQVLLGIFEARPEMFAVFRMIIKWARRSSLIRDEELDQDKAIFATAEMYAIAIHLLEPEVGIFEHEDTKFMSRNLEKIVKRINDFTFIGESLVDFFRMGQSLPESELMIRWQRSDVRDVKIPAPCISRLKKACSQALHCVRVTRDIDKVLMNASDSTDTQTTIVKKLPLSLSHSVRPALQFHASSWSFRSGAKVELREEIGEDRIIVYAEGSRYSLAELRTLLSDLTRTKRSLVIGVPTKQASRYFLAGSTLMLMRNSDKLDCRVGFSDSQGTYQLNHAASQRSTPILKHEEPVDPARWLSKRGVPSLAETMTRQLAGFPMENEHYVKNVEISARFGTFYTVNIAESLPKTQKTLSLEEFQTTCERGRAMRKTLERGKFTKVRTAHKNQHFQMVHLPKGRGHADIADNKTSKMKRMKKRTGGISMSYNTGVLNPMVDQKDTQVEAARKVYKEVLESLGFAPVLGHDGSDESVKVPGHVFEEHWKVTVNASTGYEITLNFDSNLNLLSMNERNLSWVHATVFHGREVSCFANSNLIFSKCLLFRWSLQKEC